VKPPKTVFATLAQLQSKPRRTKVVDLAVPAPTTPRPAR